jgi:hypothetical protein
MEEKECILEPAEVLMESPVATPACRQKAGSVQLHIFN